MLAYNAVFQRLRGMKQLSANIPRMTAVRCSTTDSADKKENVPPSQMDLAKPFEAIPHFRMFPILGTTWTYLPIIGRYDVKEHHLAFMDKQQRLGDIYREKYGSLNLVWIHNPDDARIMFRNEGIYPFRVELTSLKKYRESRKEWYSSTGVLVLQGKEWHDLRSKVQKHLMKRQAVHAYLDPMQDVARDFVDKIYRTRDDKNEVPEFLEELYKWALESVAVIGLDTRLGCLDWFLSPDSDSMQIIKAVQTKFRCLNEFESFGGSRLWMLFPTPKWRKFTAASDVFTVMVLKHINRAINELKRTAGEGKELTLLQSMLMTKGLDPSGAVVTVVDLVMGGIDTTSHAVGFFLYHMARNPEKQELLYQEIMRCLPEKEDRITPAIFNELRYLKACMKESQRLHPLFNAIVRTLDHDVILSGYRVPAKTLIILNTYTMGLDDRYFPNPKKFLPARWLNKDDKFHPFAFLPFGHGTRSCIGRRLAELALICVLTELIRNFRIEYHHEDIGVHSKFVNEPDKKLRYKFIVRQQ